MNSPLFIISNPHPSRQRGVALVITLAMLVTITLMVVLFTSVVSQDRQATQGYTRSLNAEQIALGGLDQVASQLRSEISDPNNSVTNGSGASTIYMPLTNSDGVPQRVVPSSCPSLITVSGTNIYSDGVNLASASLTTNASLNSRVISLSRWNKPQFAAGTNGFPAPQWILVTRGGPQKLSWSASLATNALGNPNFVVGRYAYAIYDISGLIDINVAGYTNSVNASGKGLLPWADLTQLTNAISQTDVNHLINWRNQANAAKYSTYVTNWATNGFMQVAPGDTTFLSRQDLIDYAKASNPDLTNALPYLTTFSREVNGPTWGPITNLGGNYNYRQNATNTSATVTNVDAYIPKVTVGGWSRQNGTTAVVGDPLVKYRFPLDKLALLDQQNIATLSPSQLALILKYFGLVPDPSSTGYYRKWIYTNPAGGAASVTKILTLNQVANLASPREPDFFELLQAGILNGSLGRGNERFDCFALTAGNGYYPSTWVDPDTRADYQIVRIGANIIDQYTQENCPTTITYNNYAFYGIKDLPYINTWSVQLSPISHVSAPTVVPTAHYYFQLWNPHQASTAPSISPTFFRIKALPTTTGDGYSIQIVGDPTSDRWSWSSSGSGSWSGGGTVQPWPTSSLTFTSPYTGFREPSVILPANSPSITCSTLTPSVGGWDLTPFPTNFPTGVGDWNANYATGGIKFNFKLTATTTFEIDWSLDGKAYYPYSTFVGMLDYASGLMSGNFLGEGNASTAVSNAMTCVKSDPRTFRFGAGICFGAFNASIGEPCNPNQSLNPTAGTVNIPVTSAAPFIYQTGMSTVNPYRMDLWSVNDNAVTTAAGLYLNPLSTSFYADNDGVQRVGDARYSYPGSSPFYTGSTTNRPVILNHPFHSVGDLGYAFRDEPWKTLDFSSPNSADAGLLDLFTLSDAPVIAGRVNPNTPYPQVLAALISGATQNSGSGTMVSTNSALAVGNAIYGLSTNTPFLNRADLVTRFMTNANVTTLAPSGIKTEREAVVRAVAESANTRTWNFMVDIIAQSGRYPASATGLDNFIVDGERRYWMHIAIDRYTGQVVDRQLEIVNE